MALPDWVTTETRAIPAVMPSRRRSGHKHSAVAPFVDVARRELLSEESAARAGFLQQLDPRAKLFCAMLLVVTTSMASSIPAAAISLLAAFSIGLASQVRPRSLLGALVPPLAFTSAMILPACLNVVTPGKPLLELARLGAGREILGWKIPEMLAITAPGAMIVARFVLRSGACVCWVADLTLTTRWAVLLSALRSLGAPKSFTMTMTMTYRYLFTLIRHAEETAMAKESRTISRERALEADRSAAARMGNTFHAARRLGEQVYLAMTARGFSGRATCLDRPRLGRRDIGAGTIAICAAAALAILDRTAARGHL